MSFSDVLKQRAKTASASNSGLSAFQQTLVSRGANAQDLIKANQERYTASLPNDITMTINPEAQYSARRYDQTKEDAVNAIKQQAASQLRQQSDAQIKSTNAITPSTSVFDNKAANKYQNQVEANKNATGAFADASALDVAGTNAATGIVQFGTSVSGLLDAAFGWIDFNGDKSNFVSRWAQNMRSGAQQWGEEAQEVNKNAGKVAGAIGQYVVQPVYNALPQAMLALASGGSSVAATLPEATGTGLMSTVANGLKTVISNPMFWTSAAQEMGGAFNDAISAGADRNTAATTGLITGLINGTIEIEGGIETLPKEVRNLRGWKAVMKWVKSTLDEGKEEILQDTIGELVSKITYEPNKPFYSTTGQAVINPKQILQEGISAMSGAAILGGVQTIVVNLGNPSTASAETVKMSAQQLNEYNAQLPENFQLPKIDETNATAQDVVNFATDLTKATNNAQNVQQQTQTAPATVNTETSTAQNGVQTQSEQTPVVTPVNKQKTVQPQTTAQSETVQTPQTATQTAVAERPVTDKASFKKVQADIVTSANPITDNYHVGIRSADDIKTYDETINDDESFVWGDFSKSDAEKAVRDGKVKVYSSKPIGEVGGFISTSKNMAKDYAGEGKVYEKTVPLTSVAWINGDEGQYTGEINSTTTDTDTFGKSVGAAMPNPKMTNAQLVKKYGAIEQGEEPRARDIEIAKETNAGKVSRWTRTVAESGVTDDTMVDTIKSMVEDNTLTYTPVSNVKHMQKAEARLASEGYDTMLGYVKGLFGSQSRIKADDVALAEVLYQNAIKNQRYNDAADLVADIAALGTEMGQSINALRILKQLGPQGELLTMQKMIKRLNTEFADRFGKKFKDIKLSDETIKDIMSQTDDAGLQSAMERAAAEVGQQLPASWVDKVNGWRMISMLFNPKTWVKNGVGNVLMLPLRAAKNVFNTAIQKVSLSQSERTAAILNRFNPEDNALLKYANEDFNNVKTAVESTGKYNPSDIIRENRKIFNTKAIEWVRTFTNKVLERTDIAFLRETYKTTLAGWMKAKGLTVDTITDAQLDEARIYATKEAQKATFRDASAVANAIQQFGKINPALYFLVEGTVPFKKTPINILKRGVEYSPLGFIKATTEGISNMISAKNGTDAKYTSADIIDSISSGLTGTGVMLLGMLLKELGILYGSGGDDDKKNAFENLTGSQNYSLRIGDKTMTLDWASPAAMPLFAGVELYSNLFGDEQSGSKSFFGGIESLTKALSNITEPVFDMSMLSGISSSMEAATYSGSNPFSSFFVQAGENYASQFVPTIGGTIARIIDGTRRTTSAPSSSEVPALTKWLNKQISKIPILESTLEPYIDQWGRTDTESNLGERLLENIVLPGYIEDINVTSVDKQLYSLYGSTKDSSILPSYAPKSFSVNNVDYDLDAEQYTKFATSRGKTAYNTLNALFSTSAYSRMTEKQKVTAIQRVYNYASDEAKSEFADFDRSDWETAAKDGKLGYTVAQVIAYRTLTADITPNYDARGNAITGTGKTKKIQALQKAGMSYADAANFYETYLS